MLGGNLGSLLHGDVSVMFHPYKPQLHYKRLSLRGLKIHRRVKMMNLLNNVFTVYIYM